MEAAAQGAVQEPWLEHGQCLLQFFQSKTELPQAFENLSLFFLNHLYKEKRVGW